MTQEERLKLTRELGRLDHVISFLQIERSVSSAFLKDNDDDFFRGLCKGSINTADNALETLLSIRSNLEQITGVAKDG